MGFLDPKERVLDIVLTDTGKQLLLKGELRFSYWIPFDDEVDYQSLEDPLIVEATSGRFGLNNTQEDTTNLFRPMFTAKPGTGHVSPIPSVSLSETGSIDVTVRQTQVLKRHVLRDVAGNEVSSDMQEVGFQRSAAATTYLDVGYLTGSYSNVKELEGFLVTVYQNVSGTYHEILHNRSSDGNVAYRNDLALRLGD